MVSAGGKVMCIAIWWGCVVVMVFGEEGWAVSRMGGCASSIHIRLHTTPFHPQVVSSYFNHFHQVDLILYKPSIIILIIMMIINQTN